jgi:hypothetical protein
MGSTNYGKLTNVSVVPQASPAAIAAAGATGGFPGSNYNQVYEFIILCVNNNIVRIKNTLVRNRRKWSREGPMVMVC